MMLNKFQRDRERQQYKEEAAHHNEGHWRCPFFVNYWEERLTLLMVDDCLECNGLYRDGRSYKKPHLEHGPRRPIIRERGEYEPRISVHDRLGGRVPVHDRLGGQDHVA